MLHHGILQRNSLFSFLHTLDVDLAETTRQSGCPCGGSLGKAHYTRKPRGGPPDLPEEYSVRLSLCCGTEGCRKRTLPPSVLFWGRKVYWGSVILVLTALREGRASDSTAARLKQLFGVTRFTLRRWRRYFRDVFPTTHAWLLLCGRLNPPVRAGAMGELLGRFVQAGGDPQSGLAACLAALRIGVM